MPHIEDRDQPILRDLLYRAVETPLHQRTAFLDRECDGDPRLRAELDALLTALHDASEFLTPPIGQNEPTASPILTPFWPNRLAAAVDLSISGYTLLQQIGEGGMAIVFLAEQLRPVRRRVAIKVIKPGMDSAAVLTRFQAERQALAMMDHPNIARVFDAGAASTGWPYFAMEYVQGIPITKYCDSRRMTLRQRLELFISVCNAIQHAHQKGIIHRDIKPTNVLVSHQNDKPIAKVIDFGVAKALDQNLTEQTLHTQLGSFVGTLQYMSPEQAGTDTLGADTRTDVYSLGVLLYELLTGATPLDPAQSPEIGIQQKLQALRQSVPPKPSTRLSHSPADLLTLSHSRQIEPRKLSRAISGDLDCIVMKCLEIDRARRYHTADALVQDIQRHLDDQPVEASPASTLYWLRKLVARHRASVIFALVLIGSLLAGLIVITIALKRANRAETNAQQERQNAQNEQHRAQNSAAMMRLQKGNAFIALGKLGQAESEFELAHDELARLKGEDWIADLGLWDLCRNANPPFAQWKLGSNRILSTRFLPDGKSAVILHSDGTLLLMEMPYGKILIRQNIPKPAQELKLSKDGKKAFISDADGNLYIWHMDDKIPVLLQTGIGRLVDVDQTGQQTLHVAPNIARIWHADGHIFTYTIPGIVKTGSFVDATHFITGGMEGAGLRLWQTDQPNPLWTYDIGCGLSSAVTQDGRFLAISRSNDDIQIWRVAERAFIRTLTGHTGRVSDLSWSPDQQHLYSASWDGTGMIWSIDAGKPYRILRGSKEPLNSITASSDGNRVFAGAWDGTARLWDARRVPASLEFQCVQQSRYGKHFALLCDNRILAVGEATSPTELYDRFTGIQLTNLGPDSRTSGLHRGATQTELIYASFDGTDVIYDLEQNKITGHLGTPEPFGDSGQTYSFRAQDAPTALIWRRNRDLVAWNLATRKPIRELEKVQNGWEIDVSRDGRFALGFSGFPATKFTLYSLDSTSAAVRESLGGGGASGTFSNDGQYLLTRRYHVEAFANLWRTRDLSFVRRIPDEQSVFSSDRFWPDDRYLLSAAQNDDQVLRDAKTNEVLYTVSAVGYMFAHPTRDIWVVDRGFDHRALIGDLRWPARRRQLLEPARQAIDRIAAGKEDADSLHTAGKWFALHGVDDWAASALSRARELGADISPQELAQCYARMGDIKSAAREYRLALAKATDKSEIVYLQLCLKHYESPSQNK